MSRPEVAASNARTLAQAVTAVATEIARTGIDVASISVVRAYGLGAPIRVSVQVVGTEQQATVARLFPGLPRKPRYYAHNASREGSWTGMGITVDVFGPAPVGVTA